MPKKVVIHANIKSVRMRGSDPTNIFIALLSRIAGCVLYWLDRTAIVVVTHEAGGKGTRDA